MLSLLFSSKEKRALALFKKDSAANIAVIRSLPDDVQRQWRINLGNEISELLAEMQRLAEAENARDESRRLILASLHEFSSYATTQRHKAIKMIEFLQIKPESKDPGWNCACLFESYVAAWQLGVQHRVAESKALIDEIESFSIMDPSRTTSPR